MSTTETTEMIYPVRIDYSQSLQEMVDAGRYDWVHSDVTQEHFPIEGEGTQEVDLVLVHLNKWVGTEDAEDEINKQSLRLADIVELLAFGAKYPDIQKQFSIVALRSVWMRLCTCRYMPFLDKYSNGRLRSLPLYWCERDWCDTWRFLAARI